MKKFLKFLIFIYFFLILLCYIFKILWLQKDAIAYFYEEPKNSLDIIYIGGSNVGAHFNPSLAYYNYGFTTGLLTSGLQPFTSTKYLIKEAQKYQNPQLYIIDLASAVDDFEYGFQDQWCRSVVDYMKFSKNRIDTINAILSYANVPKEKYIEYYFSFLMYHNSWKEIESTKFTGVGIIKGYWYYEQLLDSKNPFKEYKWPSDVNEIEPKNKEVLIDLIKYINENELNVLFVIPNRQFFDNNYGEFNYITNIIEENGYNVINFNLLNDLNIDSEHDYHDYMHLNILGATKYTLYFSKYLKEHYNLPDHRNDNRYKSWEEAYYIFEKNLKEFLDNK